MSEKNLPMLVMVGFVVWLIMSFLLARRIYQKRWIKGPFSEVTKLIQRCACAAPDRAEKLRIFHNTVVTEFKRLRVIWRDFYEEELRGQSYLSEYSQQDWPECPLADDGEVHQKVAQKINGRNVRFWPSAQPFSTGFDTFFCPLCGWQFAVDLTTDAERFEFDRLQREEGKTEHEAFHIMVKGGQS